MNEMSFLFWQKQCPYGWSFLKSTKHIQFKKDGCYLPKPSLKFIILKVFEVLQYCILLREKCQPWPVSLGYSRPLQKQRRQANVNIKPLSLRSLHAGVSFSLTIPHTVQHKQRSLVKPPVLYPLPLGHIKQPFLVKSHMHACFSIRWKCGNVLIEHFAAWMKQNLLCLNHTASIWILLKMYAA